MFIPRPYQEEILEPVMESVSQEKGITFSVEIAQQGGKNELSAYIEYLLLAAYAEKKPRNMIKCSPSFKPQTIISMARLKDRLNDDTVVRDLWTPELGYIIRLKNARAIFLSAEESANVVGHTAQILLEIDESQDVGKDKYTKEFKPMGAVGNVTTVHYGTTWDDTTLLEEIKQTNLELERKDGIRRHFRYDWQEVSRTEQIVVGEVDRELLGIWNLRGDLHGEVGLVFTREHSVSHLVKNLCQFCGMILAYSEDNGFADLPTDWIS